MKEYNETYHARILVLASHAKYYPDLSNIECYNKKHIRDKRRMITALKEDIQILLFVGSKVCYLFSGNKEEYNDMKCWSKGTVEEGVANNCNETVEMLPNWVIDKLQFNQPLCQPVYCIIYSNKIKDSLDKSFDICMGGIVAREYDTTTQQWK